MNLLSIIWLSKIKIPGRDLPDDDAWQVEEAELMTAVDYDAIIDEGFGSWVERYYAERLPGVPEGFGCFVQSLPDAFAAWREKGIVVFSPVVTTIPYEYFCGGRSMQQFMLDLHRQPDKVQAAMDASMPFLKEQMRQLIRGFSLMGLWIGGWRAASEFLSPRLWERFVFPYYKELADVAIEEGAIPVLHFDADWTRDLERFREFPKGKCVLSLDGKTDIFKAKELLGDHMCLMGDVPARMLTLGTPQEVSDYSHRLIREVGPGRLHPGAGLRHPAGRQVREREGDGRGRSVTRRGAATPGDAGRRGPVTLWTFSASQDSWAQERRHSSSRWRGSSPRGAVGRRSSSTRSARSAWTSR